MGFFWEGKVFRKTFRILELCERRRRRVVEQDFHGNFQVNVTCFFFFCVFLLSLTGLSSFWHGLKDIFTLYKLAADKVGLDHYKWLRQKR